MTGTTVALIVLAVVAAVAIATLVGVVILRAAVSLYNKIAGGADSASAVPEPSFREAMDIVLLTMVIDAAVGAIVGIVVGATGMATSLNRDHFIAIAALLSLPVGFLVMASMVSVSLPTTFARGILVTLCDFMIRAVIVGGSALAAFASFLILD